ncbi:glycosidase [Lacibacter cauensis]|uniref:Glycosidase n=1 Tax=Lacibacter cauensis TaxID=510947 RepID=A0A562SYI2_9BACT|nr:glycoside hydrolase family 13 protein [Lacibacter cauensis]TWI85720.1 glycosidase [Lacibacter cauensis]
MRKRLFLLQLLLTAVTFSFAQNSYELYPSNWWVGMKYNKIQLMIRGNDVGKHSDFSIRYPGVTLTKVNRFSNRNYVILDITIAPVAKPGTIGIRSKNAAGKQSNFEFDLVPRRKGNGTAYANGATSSDLMYLIMPDRFSNGDPSNDRVPGMLDQTLRRDTVFNRHGGDLKGIQNHLDYFTDLGVTALWLNPIIENDMPERTEHGYAFTNHYKVDRRLGGNEAYRNLINAAHAKGIKIIQDAVYNHVGIEHILFKDQPDSTWFHRWPKFTQTNYKDQALFDPYAAAIDKKIMSDGWFVPSMPDWDQSNPFVQNFLIQHAIWTVEQFGIDGWRIDTYAYNDLVFMNKCNKALYDEYPRISIFGETWVHGVPNQSFFCENKYNIPYKSNLQATTDFQLLFYGIQPACNDKFGWTDGVNKLYTTAAQDYVYKDPMRQVIFLDNHDLPRFYSVVGEDTSKYKMAFAWMLTFRGIPQMYYGNEILMTGFTSPNDGYVRQDFPGGWEGDKDNKFTAAGRTEKENKIFNYIKRLANFRKTSSAIKTGKLMQFLPADGVYVYFRYDAKQTVMCVMNTNAEPKTIDLTRFTERIKGFSSAVDVAAGVEFKLEKELQLMPVSNLVLELK